MSVEDCLDYANDVKTGPTMSGTSLCIWALACMKMEKVS